MLCPRCEQTFVAAASAAPRSDDADPAERLLNTELPVVFGPVLLKPRSDTPPRTRRRRRVTPKLRRSLCIASICLGLLVAIIACWGWVGRKVADRLAVTETTKLVPMTEWQADPADKPQLGPPKNVEAFQINLPKGYLLFGVMREPVWLPPDARFIGLEFEGQLGNQAQLRCMIITFSGREPLTGSLHEALDRFYSWIQHNGAMTALSYDAGVVGMLNKRYVIRSSFSGKQRLHGKLTSEDRKGELFVMIDGDRQICLYSWCTPEGQELLPLLESSMLTWHTR